MKLGKPKRENTGQSDLEQECFDQELVMPYLKHTYRLEGGTAFINDENGDACGVYHAYGKGKAYLIGGAPSLHFRPGTGKYEGPVKAGKMEEGASQKELFCSLFMELGRAVGVAAPVAITGGTPEVTARYLRNDRETLVFLINYSKKEQADMVIENGLGNRAELSRDTQVAELTREGRQPLQEGRIVIPPASWKVISIEER